MCGICGIIGIGDEELLKKMCAVISHRGPDDEGIYINNKWGQSTVGQSTFIVGLGVRRLSIIDLKTGYQPIHNEDSTVWIAYNGEIYNFIELRKNLEDKGHRFYTKTDTEVIVHLYEEYGKDCVKYLRGMFAFAIWDEKNQRVMLFRDRVGKKLLYYTRTASGFLFASEIKSLLQCNSVKREVNLKSLSHYLTFNYVPGPETMFSGIFNLPPASILTYENSEIKVEEYWDLHYEEDYSHSEEYWLGKIEEKLNESVKLRLISDVPLGAFLSGGLDSSVVVALMSKFMNEPVKTFSVSFKGPKFYDESGDFNLVANLFQTDHHELIVEGIDVMNILPKLVWHFDQPFADIVALPTYLISKFARQYVKVVLTGDGGDEVFAGYLRYPIDNYASLYQKIPLPIRQWLISVSEVLPELNRVKKALRGLSEGNEAIRYSHWIAQMTDDMKQKLYLHDKNRDSSFNLFIPLFEGVKGASSLNRRLYLDIKNWLGNAHLGRIDRTSMANSLEARCPFLDQELIELCARIPSRLKLKGFTTKYLLRKIAQKTLPKQIADKKKHGFTVPISHWLRGELRNFAYDILTDIKARNRGYFDMKYVQIMLDEHIRGRNDFGTSIWALLNFELWHQMFIDENVISRSQIAPLEIMLQQVQNKTLLLAVDFPSVSGGEAVYAYNLWRNLPAEKITVIVPYYEGAEDFDGMQDFKIYRSKAWASASTLGKVASIWSLFSLAKQIIKKEMIKEVHCLHLLSTGIIGYLLNKTIGLPYYVYIFGAEFREHRGLNWLQRIILNNAKGIIAIADFIKQEAIKAGVKNRNFIKITPGVDVHRFSPGLNCKTIIKKYNLEEKKVILTISRLDWNKGVDMAIKSLPLVLEKVPNAIYLVGGTGPCEKEWKKLVEEMKLQDKIIFTGFISDKELPLYYNACDVFLLPTRELAKRGCVEGFGIVFLEANACAKPVIAGRAGGVPEAVVDGVTGIIVDPLNIDEISDVLIKLLTDEKLAKETGEAGRKRVEQEFSWQSKSKILYETISSKINDRMN